MPAPYCFQLNVYLLKVHATRLFQFGTVLIAPQNIQGMSGKFTIMSIIQRLGLYMCSLATHTIHNDLKTEVFVDYKKYKSL